MSKVKITAISDLHGDLPSLPGGDLLVIAGDITGNDKVVQWHNFYEWFKVQKYRKKLYIGGNHDNFLTHVAPREDRADIAAITGEPFEHLDTYLCDEAIEWEGLKIYGSPWTLNFWGQNPRAKAFGLDTPFQMAEKWAMIPDDTQILVTHSPAFGMLDYNPKHIGARSHRFGCKELAKRLPELKQLRLHIHGHIHGGYGIRRHKPYIVINGARMDDNYDCFNKPISIHYKS